MFSKTSSNTPQPSTPTSTGPSPSPTPTPAPQSASSPATQSAVPPPTPEPARSAPRPPKAPSIIGADLTIEGDVSGGGELQIEGTIKGDVRIEHVTVGDGGAVEGGIYAEAVEVRGRVTGSITAKQVRLYGACHVDGDITHEQLAMETGAFFQGRSLRLQRAAQASPSHSPAAAKSEPPRDSAAAASNSAKPASASPAA